MLKSVVTSDQAEQDISDTACFIGSDNWEAAERFINAVDAASQSLSKRPLRGAAFRTSEPRLQSLRKLAVPGFSNHLIFFAVLDDHIRIVRVIHGARDLPNRLLDNE